MSAEKHMLPGRKGVSEVLRHKPGAIRKLYLREGVRLDPPLAQQIKDAEAAGVSVQTLAKIDFDALVAGQQAQGVAAVVEPRFESIEEMADRVLAAGTSIVVCDQVSDPHNLGAILRVAEAAGVGGLVLTKDHSADITATVRKVSAGASELLPLCRVANLQRALKLLKARGFWIVGAALDSDSVSLYEAPELHPTALVIGSEGSGIRQLTKKLCDVLVEIPMNGRIASLNVSQAVSVILFEMYRKQLVK